MGSLAHQKCESRGGGRLEITFGEVVQMDSHEYNSNITCGFLLFLNFVSHNHMDAFSAHKKILLTIVNLKFVSFREIEKKILTYSYLYIFIKMLNLY